MANDEATDAESLAEKCDDDSAARSLSSAAAMNEVAELRAEVAQLKSQLSHQMTASKREQESQLKLVIGMAIGGYGFDRKAARSKITKEVADDLRRSGVPLDEATILKHLRRAAELLPPEE